MILVDANVLLRLGNEDDPEYRRAQRTIFAYRATDTLVIVPQTLYEFWAVATRAPGVNGLGMEISRVRLWLATCQRMFALLPEPSDIVRVWSALVEKYDIKGFRAHDARYVAMMQVYGVDKLMTYNVKHFDQFPIGIIDPRKN